MHSSRMRTRIPACIAGGCTCRRGVYLSRRVYLPRECNYPGGCTCPRGVPVGGVYMPRGGTCPGGVPVQGDVPAQGVVCTCPEWAPAQVLPPVNRMTDKCKYITLPQTSFGDGKNESGYSSSRTSFVLRVATISLVHWLFKFAKHTPTASDFQLPLL